MFSLFKYERLTYGDYIYPWWGDFIGWMLTLSSAVLVPLYAIYSLISNTSELNEVNSNKCIVFINIHYIFVIL